MSKASINTDLRDYGGFRNPEEIVFTNADELSKYNEKLLHGFITYLNKKNKKTHSVFHCGAYVQIVNDSEVFVKEFNDFIMSQILQ